MHEQPNAVPVPVTRDATEIERTRRSLAACLIVA
jgi:hypothetical protein